MTHESDRFLEVTDRSRRVTGSTLFPTGDSPTPHSGPGRSPSPSVEPDRGTLVLFSDPHSRKGRKVRRGSAVSDSQGPGPTVDLFLRFSGIGPFSSSSARPGQRWLRVEVVGTGDVATVGV